MKIRQAGFTVIELAIVVVIALIITTIALPAVRRTMTSYQLDTSGHAVATMLQQVRTAAVKADTPYYAQYNVLPNSPTVAVALPAARFAALNYDPSADPAVSLASNVTFLPAGGAPPDHAQLEAAMGVGAGAAQVGGVIAFNGRGLPCLATANPVLCNGGPVPGAPPAFEWFIQSSMALGWEAVTVSPAGRIKVWRLTAINNGNCGFPACWQ